jgi:hypothetical protein
VAGTASALVATPLLLLAAQRVRFFANARTLSWLDHELLCLCCVSVAALFPMILIARVSEQYVSLLTPVISIMLALGMYNVLSEGRAIPRWLAPMCLAGTAIAFASSSAAIVQKSSAMRAVSDTTWHFIDVIAGSKLNTISRHAKVCIVGDVSRSNIGETQYSIYAQSHGLIVTIVLMSYFSPRNGSDFRIGTALQHARSIFGDAPPSGSVEDDRNCDDMVILQNGTLRVAP